MCHFEQPRNIYFKMKNLLPYISLDSYQTSDMDFKRIQQLLMMNSTFKDSRIEDFVVCEIILK